MLLLGTLALVSPTHAQDAGEGIASPRSVGRAGTSTVSGDSGIALISNPAGMVRRSQQRLLLSASIRDSDTSYEAADSPASPTLVNRASNKGAPLLAYHRGSESGVWVLGAMFMSGSSELSLPTPAFGQPDEDVTRLFPHRYGGTEWVRQWRRIAVGGAVRIGESVGLGASASLGQVRIRESRRMWAGFAGRDRLLDPSRDLALQLSGDDSYNPGASLGVLVAPPEIPLEFALAFEFRRGQHFRQGKIAIAPTTNNEFPSATLDGASASLRLPSSYNLRSGIRYLGERFFVEAGVDLFYIRSDAPRMWSLEGVEINDQSGLVASFDKAQSLVSLRTQVALRAAVDYELLTGYLWLTGGYAYESPRASRSLQSPGFARLGGHTLALGLETAYEDFTISLGYARHLERSRSVASTQSALPVINPFDAGSASANAGRYRQSSDQLGFAIEHTWE